MTYGMKLELQSVKKKERIMGIKFLRSIDYNFKRYER